MTTKLNKKQNGWKVLIIFFLIVFSFSMLNTSSVFASPRTDTLEISRSKILNTASLYANHIWTATEHNIYHEANYETRFVNGMPIRDPEDLRLLYLDQIIEHSDHTPGTPILDTPNQGWTYGDDNGHTGWWVADGTTWSVGVPYAWGGSTPIDLFDAQIANGFPAGNINTVDGRGGTFTNGVDCEGFVELSWGISTRLGMSDAQDSTRPIRFADLRPGDILMSLDPSFDERTSHVILFKEFINYTGGDPVLYVQGGDNMGATKIKVYEASYSAGKVVEKTYMLTAVNSVPVTNPQSLDKRFLFNSQQFPTDEVYLIDAANLTSNGAPDPSIEPLVYIPRTFFSPVRVMIAIDKSGSMDQLGQAQAAAMFFIMRLRPGDWIGVVAFNSEADIVYPLTEIQEDAAEKDAAINAILEQISSPGGGTFLSSGLAASHNELWRVNGNAAYANSGEAFTLLLSDGQDGQQQEYLDAAIGHFPAAKITLETIGIGDEYPELLKRIAELTGGQYFSSNNNMLTALINGILTHYILPERTNDIMRGSNTVGEPGAVSALPNGIFTSYNLTEKTDDVDSASNMIGESDTEFDVDSTMDTVTVSIFSSEGNFDFTLTPQDGDVITPSLAETDPNIEYVSGPTYAFYKIRAPQPGNWTINVTGTAGQAYDFSAATRDAMNFSVESDRKKYLLNEPIIVTASIAESGALTGPEFIPGVIMNVTVEDPNGNTSSFPLLDDGINDDGIANNQIYANAFNNTSLEGIYTFTVQASGNNNRDGQPFTREQTFYVDVIPPPRVDYIVRSSPNPASGETVNFRVTFSRDVTGVDESDFDLTTTGVTDAAISSVTGSGKLYTVTVNTGTEEGTIRLDVLDDDTIVDEYSFPLEDSYTSGPVFTIDKTAPSVLSIVRTSINPTTYYNVNYIVTFSEPVEGVNSSDFGLTTDGITGASVASVEAISGSGYTTYTVIVTTGSGSGTIRLDVIDDDTIDDDAGGKLGGLGTGNGNFISGDVYDVDGTASSPLVNKLEDTNDGLCEVDCSLREAIASAAPGETVTFDAVLTGGTIHLASTLTLSRNITIDGSGLVEPIIISGDTDSNGAADVQVFRINSGVAASLNAITITKGTAANGGGIFNNGHLTLTNSTISDNSVTISGGGIFSDPGTLTIKNSIISNNSASLSGGGIYKKFGTLSIIESALTNNTAMFAGGGISGYYSTTSLVNSTFSSNSAGKEGGGIYSSDGTLTLINDTFSGSSAPLGGGIMRRGNNMLNYANTIIANSITGEDCVNEGPLGTNIQNLVEDGTCSAILNGDPDLSPLADNGGPTQTMALLPGSPAISAGDKTVCTNAPVNNLDQRGKVRLVGGQCDIGAYEVYVDPALVPSVDTFEAASFSTSLNIPITELTGSDDEGVTGYMVTESPLPPAVHDAGWSATAPTMYTVSAEGTHTLYPWVNDATGYISSVFTSPVTVTVSLPTATPTLTSTPTQTPPPTETPTPTHTPTPYPNVLVDDFDNATLSSYWEWYVPKTGPIYSLSAVPGSLRMRLPAGDTFEHWLTTDEAPQLRLKNFNGGGDWAIETELENIQAAADAGYWAALEVGFAGSDQIWFGMVDDGYLKSIRISEELVDFAVDESLPITLRLEKIGEEYTFKYKQDSYDPWTVMTVKTYPGTPAYVGLIGRGFNTGSAELLMDWSYFRVENWSAATPTPVIPTDTATPVETLTPSLTPTPTTVPTTIVDEFDGTLLGSDWEWYLPAIGPNYSLSAEPDKLQVVIPPGYDHWVDLDSSPQIRRDDMGDGNWAIETYLGLDDANAGDAWQADLVAGFGRYDQQWLSIDGENNLRVTRVGGGDTALVSEINLPLYLRMERTGSDYTFKYKEASEDPWITLDVQIINDPVAYVGLQFRSFDGSSGDAIFNIDYFQMESSNPPDLGPEKEIEVDDFDNLTLNGDWTWDTPKDGPTYSLAAVPGSFRMSLPAFDSFEHWDTVDEAPQLQRRDLGDGDWAIETQLENIDATDAGYWAALEAGFDEYDQIWYGMVDDGNLKIYRLSEGEYASLEQSLPLILRLEKHGEEYVFKYRHDPDEAWTTLAPTIYEGTPTYVGLIGRAFDTGSTEMHLDWSYFRLERWEAEQGLMALEQGLSMEGSVGSNRLPERDDTRQPGLPISATTPTRTRVVFPTVTPTPTRAPTRP